MQGKNILEIGGNSNCATARPFLDAGAESVIISGLDHVNEETTQIDDNNIQIVKADVRHLTDVFEVESFDVVYGIAVLEHIRDLHRALSEIKKVLKPGGLVYLAGDPVWSGPLGHHLWVNPFQNKSIGTYLFTNHPAFENSTNPIPDWGHLLMTASEMGEHLQRKGIPCMDIIRIIEWIYLDENLNRLSIGEICSAFSKSDLCTLMCNLTEDITAHNPHKDRGVALGSQRDAMQELARRNSLPCNFAVTGVEYVLSKTL